MVWFKVDDGLPTSRKILSIPRSVRLSAVGLWTLAGAWSAGEELDGHVPDYMVTELGGTPRLVQALIDSRLWLEVADGAQFSNWEEYQPTRADLEAGRAKETERKRRWRERHSPSSVPLGQDAGRERLSEHPDPTRPDPTPSSTKKITTSASRGTRLAADWIPPTEEIAKAKADYAAHVDLKSEHEVFVDYWIAQAGAKGVKADWVAVWRNWMRRKESDSAGKSGAKLTPEQRARQTLALASNMRELE